MHVFIKWLKWIWIRHQYDNSLRDEYSTTTIWNATQPGKALRAQEDAQTQQMLIEGRQ